jgi:hypothetical protein
VQKPGQSGRTRTRHQQADGAAAGQAADHDGDGPAQLPRVEPGSGDADRERPEGGDAPSLTRPRTQTPKSGATVHSGLLPSAEPDTKCSKASATWARETPRACATNRRDQRSLDR